MMKHHFLHLVVCTLLVAGRLGLSAQDFRLQLIPELAIPLTETEIFGIGGGGNLSVSTDIFGFLAPYVQAGVSVLPTIAKSLDSSLSMFSAGTGLGLYMFPLPRLKLAASIGGGIYVASWPVENEVVMSGNLNWRAAAEAGFRVSPTFNISAAASYTDYRTETSSFLKGLGVALMVDIALNAGGGEGRVILQEASSVPVFPIFARDYQTQQFGSISIRNAESAEIRNVEIWFQAEPYTATPILCATIRQIPKGKNASAPLLAAFSEQILTITDTLRINGEIRIVYEFLGEKRMASNETTISILHRNALSWQNPQALAAFVSPNDPAVLDSSKFIAGVVRSNIQADLDSNLQYAVGLLEGFRLGGIAWAADPQTPYKATRADSTRTDYVQYPHQTIAYRSGDSDDLAVLYAAALESIGVPAGLIPLQDEVLVAFRMSSNENTTKAMFTDGGNFIFTGGEAWVPLRIANLRDGFLRAWNEGARLIQENPHGAGAFYRLTDAWKGFPPASIPGINPSTRKPVEAQVQTAFNNVISLVVAREVVPRADRIRASFGPGGGTGRQRNSLGILYARYGMYREALAEFQAAAALGEQRASINIGNIAFLLRDFETAAAWFELAVKSIPNDVAPLIGLARTYYELDMYDKADELFRKAVSLQPSLSDRYSYLSARLTGSVARASAAMDRIGDMMWEE